MYFWQFFFFFFRIKFIIKGIERKKKKKLKNFSYDENRSKVRLPGVFRNTVVIISFYHTRLDVKFTVIMRTATRVCIHLHRSGSSWFIVNIQCARERKNDVDILFTEAAHSSMTQLRRYTPLAVLIVVLLFNYATKSNDTNFAKSPRRPFIIVTKNRPAGNGVNWIFIAYGKKFPRLYFSRADGAPVSESESTRVLCVRVREPIVRFKNNISRSARPASCVYN